jgi:hypothetical protein
MSGLSHRWVLAQLGAGMGATGVVGPFDTEAEAFDYAKRHPMDGGESRDGPSIRWQVTKLWEPTP